MSFQGKRIPIKLNSSKKTTSVVEESLILICNAVQSIYQQKVSDLSFEEIYRNCYQTILHHCGDVLYTKVTECMAQQATSILQVCFFNLFVAMGSFISKRKSVNVLMSY